MMKEDISLFLATEKFLQDKMYFHQGMRVVNDVDLSEVFKVDVKELRMKARKNMERFPPDFMVEINDGEFAFAEPGIIMLGGLLESESAIKVHLQFIGYFICLAHDGGRNVFDLLI